MPGNKRNVIRGKHVAPKGGEYDPSMISLKSLVLQAAFENKAAKSSKWESTKRSCGKRTRSQDYVCGGGGQTFLGRATRKLCSRGQALIGMTTKGCGPAGVQLGVMLTTKTRGKNPNRLEVKTGAER